LPDPQGEIQTVLIQLGVYIAFCSED
jgi:hypothetical protein